VWLGSSALILSLIGVAVAVPLGYLTVHHTAQPEFCNSCHIMEPYYESWKHSSHADVGCIECHYEPGAVETFVGKFKALSQLSKYVTRTQGTKPWAEVSDESCMRSGCHSVRMLDGPVKFGNVAFDHRHHLLEARRGRQLQCVSCHSQIVQGEHVSVTDSVCFMCHFMPHDDGDAPAASSDCLTCHGAPTETVRRERCHSCHAEIGHIERIGEIDFMHEMHVTEHKVECFECHDEIRHGLLPLATHEPAESEGCGSCHQDSHGTAKRLYAGTGAFGTEDAPSRMFETRVVCEACHTGRSNGASAALHARPHEASPHSVFADAGNVDCIHCHGPEFDGMLAAWQSTVASELDQVRPLLDELEDHLPEAADHPARVLFDEARHNVDLVALDGSYGAHNLDYALAALEAGAERIDEARALVGLAGELHARDGLAFRSEHGCTTCHLGVERTEVARFDERAFPHGPHLQRAELDCDSCHSLEEHGAPAAGRQDCASCHHAESEQLDVWDCAACHGAQESLLRGDLAGLPASPGSMSDMECIECHGEPPTIVRPKPSLCVLCHEDGYDRFQGEWQDAVSRELERLRPVLETVEERLGDAGEHPARPLYDEALRSIELVTRDGSLGVHNVHAALNALEAAAERLDGARELLELEAPEPASAGFPYRTELGCGTCHVGIEEARTLMPNDRLFPHRAHIQSVELDCDACHGVEEEDHGETFLSPSACANCHHEETDEYEYWNCAKCHTDQRDFLVGAVEGLGNLTGTMAEMECAECHGEPPNMIEPTPALCALCHEEGYDDMQIAWQARTDELLAELEQALEAAAEGAADPALLARARRVLAAVRRDGSRGVHNFELISSLLEDALRSLRDE
jgi:nitrate/TMAO reductase-like tetraheme cytochrome c subunit